MPFNLPYEAAVKPTDLIYGLAHIRGLYLLACDEFIKISKASKIYIDRYAITMAERLRLSGRPYIEDDDFKEFVALHPKYKSAMTMPYFVAEAIDKTTAKKLGLIYHSNPTSVTRKCKAGIAWTAKNNHVNSVNLHFILDGINMQEIVSKTNRNDIEFDRLEEYLAHEAKYSCKDSVLLVPAANSRLDVKFKNRMITGAELRWIYRNRNNPAVQKTIQFWYKQAPCCPPWQKGFDAICGKPVARLWKQYHPSSKPIVSSRLNIMARFCSSTR